MSPADIAFGSRRCRQHGCLNYAYKSALHIPPRVAEDNAATIEWVNMAHLRSYTAVASCRVFSAVAAYPRANNSSASSRSANDNEARLLFKKNCQIVARHLSRKLTPTKNVYIYIYITFARLLHHRAQKPSHPPPPPLKLPPAPALAPPESRDAEHRCRAKNHSETSRN